MGLVPTNMGKCRGEMGLYNRFCKRFFAAVIIRLTAQSDSRAFHPSHFMPLALILPRGDQYVCMYVCIFIELHITAQSGPVILVILCHSH